MCPSGAQQTQTHDTIIMPKCKVTLHSTFYPFYPGLFVIRFYLEWQQGWFVKSFKVAKLLIISQLPTFAVLLL